MVKTLKHCYCIFIWSRCQLYTVIYYFLAQVATRLHDYSKNGITTSPGLYVFACR